MDGCDELVYYSDLGASEEGQQDGAGRERREREKAVVTNEALSQ